MFWKNFSETNLEKKWKNRFFSGSTSSTSSGGDETDLFKFSRTIPQKNLEKLKKKDFFSGSTSSGGGGSDLIPGRIDLVMESSQHLIEKPWIFAWKPSIYPKIRCWSRSRWSWNFHIQYRTWQRSYLSDATGFSSLRFWDLEISCGQTDWRTDAKPKLKASHFVRALKRQST